MASSRVGNSPPPSGTPLATDSLGSLSSYPGGNLLYIYIYKVNLCIVEADRCMPLLSERQPLPEKLFFSLASGILMRKKMEGEFNAKPALKLIIKKKKKKSLLSF